tara:strand:- start:301 stop:405 length:105 start_codon:yes stop_codon:yes gene_type:complete
MDAKIWIDLSMLINKMLLNLTASVILKFICHKLI